MKKAIISIFLLLLLALSWSSVLDTKAIEFNTETTKDVVVTLAITRSINAALSVVQNSSLLLGIGVQVDMAIGQVVNPINDFLDRFSWVLLFSLISLGLQSLLISLVKAKIFNILLSGVVIGVIVSFYKKFEYSDILYKFMLVLLFIRFALPVIDVANGYIYNEMMRNQILTIQKNNQKFNDEIQKFMPNNVEIQKLQQNLKTLKAQKQQILEKSTQNMSYFDRLKAKFNYDNLSFNEKSKLQNIDKQIENINKKLDKLDINPYDKMKLFIKKVEHNMDNFFTQSYTAIILFLARGIVFPILFLWGLIRLFRMEGLIQRFNR